METETLLLVYLIALALSMGILYFVVKAAVSDGTKKMQATLQRLFELQNSLLTPEQHSIFWKNYKLRELDQNRQNFTQKEYEEKKLAIFEKYKDKEPQQA
jgi:hypothetical protein